MTRFPQVTAFRGNEHTIRVIGHRGARGILPENTMLGFEFALSIGVNLLELDVVLTRDGIPVITHNHRLHAATFRGPDGKFLIGEEQKVSSIDFSELQQYDVGRIDGHSPYGRRFPDQAQLDDVRVPKLSDLLKLANKPEFSHTHLMLEPKSDPDFATDSACREQLVSSIVAELHSANMASRTLLHSFDWNLLAECQNQVPDMPTSFLTQLPDNSDEVGEDSSKSISPDFEGKAHRIPELVKEAGGSLWCPFIKDVSEELVVRAKSLGLCVAVWTVNEPTQIDRMIDYGVDAIVSDYPGRVQRQLSDRGFRW